MARSYCVGDGETVKAEPRRIRCTNQACNCEDYIATQAVRRATWDQRTNAVVAKVVGALHQCCKCGTLYYATPDGCYPAPTQFQPVRQFEKLSKPPADDDKLPELPEP